ncbi:apolipoprotein N-acyltransferase [Spirochaetota bacterium]
MSFYKKLFLSLLSAVILTLSMPNEVFAWGNPALGLIALFPLYLSLYFSSSRKEAFFLSALFGGLAHGMSSYWLWFFKDFRLWTLGSTVLAYMLVYGFLGMYLMATVKKGGLGRPFLFAMAWTVFEWAKSSGFLGYPWGLLAYSWNTVDSFIQIAESTGVYGITFTLAAFSASFAEMLIPISAGKTSFFTNGMGLPVCGTKGIAKAANIYGMGFMTVSVVLIFCIFAYGSVAMTKHRNTDTFINAILVQANTDPWDGSEAENLAISINLANEAIKSSNEKADIILFSETSLRRPYKDFVRFFKNTPPDYPLAKLITDSGAYLFAGAPEILDYESFEATNSVILIDPEARQTASYAKMHPVPFAEAIPFWEYEPVRSFIQNKVGLESGWVMGTERVIFEIQNRKGEKVTFAGPICFEDAFAYLCRAFIRDGADLLINLTNDAWSRTKSAEIQHFVAAKFRAIELRRTLVRSTNGGVSGLVLPDGSLSGLMPLFASEASFVKVPVYKGEVTPYLLFGDWFVKLLSFILLLSAFMLYLSDTGIARKLVRFDQEGSWQA